MATDRLRVAPNERVDIDDFRFLAGEGLHANLRQIGHKFLMEDADAAPQDQTGYILSGFEITNLTLKQLTVTKGKAILSQRLNGAVVRGVVTTEGDTSITLDLGSYTAGTYWIYIRFEETETDSQGRIFWSPTGTGSEYTNSVPTRHQARWGMRVEESSPGAEWLKIGEVVVSGTLSITDQRPFYYEGSVDSTYLSGWGSVALGGTVNDRSSNRAEYGVGDLHTFIRATKQCIEDIKGRGLKRWWDAGIGGMNVGFDDDPVSGRLAVGDANYGFLLSGTVASLNFDSNDLFSYERATNILTLDIGGSTGHSWTSTQYSTQNLLVSNNVKSALIPSSAFALGGSSNKWGSIHTDSAYVYYRLIMDASAEVAGSFIPDATSAYDIGSDAVRWQNGYMDMLAVSSDGTNGVIEDLVPYQAGAINLGSIAKPWDAVFARAVIVKGTSLALESGTVVLGDIITTDRIIESNQEFLWAQGAAVYTIGSGAGIVSITPRNELTGYFSGITVDSSGKIGVSSTHRGFYKGDCLLALQTSITGAEVQITVGTYLDNSLVNGSTMRVLVDNFDTHKTVTYPFFADLTDETKDVSVRASWYNGTAGATVFIGTQSQLTLVRCQATS